MKRVSKSILEKGYIGISTCISNVPRFCKFSNNCWNDSTGATGYACFTICYSKLLTHRSVYGDEVGRDTYIQMNLFFFFIVSASSRIIRLGKKVHTIHTSFDRTAKIDVIIINWFASHRQLSFVRFSIQEEWKGFRDNVGLSWNKNKSISISEAWMNRSFRRYLLRFRREQRS